MTGPERSEVEPLDDEQVAAYLARIGVTGRPEPGIESLRELQVRHLQNVPFENLSIHLGERVSLSVDDLFDKVVTRRRGGFCYELNGFFASLLTSLGYEVSLLGGGVFGTNGLGPPFDHLALLVDGWLVDVGFGRHSAYPLSVEPDVEQPDPSGTFTVAVASDGDIEVSRNGSPQYRLEPRPRILSDFGPTCWWQQTVPGSHFRTGPVCSRLTTTFGLITIADRTLVITENGDREISTLSSDDELLSAYLEHFGMALERPPVPVDG
jgi:N-hydroxyarylamine O-acetyltransferase